VAEPNRLQDKLTDAAREAWVDAARDVLISGGISALNLRGLSASLGVTTGAFYLAALRLTVLEGGIDPRFDNAVRDWAHSAPRTAQVLAQADAWKITALEKMFRALGDDDKRAMIRARVAYFHQVGYGTLEIHDDPDERLLNLRYYAEALTGRRDLFVCETADQVRHFILTGLPPETDPA
jgi:AcrR family transcriptional regulator